jgi:hypothetical protein
VPDAVPGGSAAADLLGCTLAVEDHGTGPDQVSAGPSGQGQRDVRRVHPVKGAYGDETGRELFRATGGLAALAGVCAYDADLQGTSQRYYFQALRMAKACLRRQVIQYAETALRGSPGSLSPALVTDLNSLQARHARGSETGVGVMAR